MDKTKAVLVIDMPRSCMECNIRFRDEYSDFCPVHVIDEQPDVYDYMMKFTKPDWCPLKPMPKKLYIGIDGIMDCTNDFPYGWNACINEILSK